MAVSTIKGKAYKSTDISVSLASQSWAQSYMWYCTVSNFTATKEILSIEVTSWTGLQGIPLISSTSNGTKIAIALLSKPTTGALGLRIIEEA